MIEKMGPGYRKVPGGGVTGWGTNPVPNESEEILPEDTELGIGGDGGIPPVPAKIVVDQTPEPQGIPNRLRRTLDGVRNCGSIALATLLIAGAATTTGLIAYHVWGQKENKEDSSGLIATPTPSQAAGTPTPTPEPTATLTPREAGVTPTATPRPKETPTVVFAPSTPTATPTAIFERPTPTPRPTPENIKSPDFGVKYDPQKGKCQLVDKKTGNLINVSGRESVPKISSTQTGVGVTKNIETILEPGQTAIIQGYIVDGQGNGVFNVVIATKATKFTKRITDGAVDVVNSQDALLAFCSAVQAAVNNGWAHENVIVPDQWKVK